MSTETATPPAVVPSPASPSARPPTSARNPKQVGPTPPPQFRPPAATEKVIPTAEKTLTVKISDMFADKPAAAAPVPAPAPAAAEPSAPDAPVAAPAKPVSTEAAKPVAPVEADPFADLQPPDNMPGEKAAQWNALKTKSKTEIAAAQQKVSALQAEIETLRKATPADQADMERLRAEHKQAMERLTVLDLQSTPDFAKQYSQPKKAALDEAGQIIGYQDKPVAADLPSLLGKPLKEFNAEVAAITKDMNPMDANTVQSNLRSAYKIQAQEREALSKASELHTSLESRTAQQQRQAFDATWGEVEAFLKPLPIPNGATPEEISDLNSYNQSVGTVRTAAETNAFGRLDPKGAAAIAAKAAVLDFVTKNAIPRMEKAYARIQAERDMALQELKAVKGAKSSGSFESTPTAPTAEGQKLNLQQQARKMFGEPIGR